MKNKKLLFIGVLTAFLMLAVPFAVASVDSEDVDAADSTIVDWTSFTSDSEEDAIITVNGTVTVSEPIKLGNGNKILNLNGKINYTGAEQGLFVRYEDVPASLTINASKDAVIDSKAMVVRTYVDNNNASNFDLTINGGTYKGTYAITCYSDVGTNNDVNISINDATINADYGLWCGRGGPETVSISNTTVNATSLGMYFGSVNNVVLNNVIVNSEGTGIELKSGNLNIYDSTIIGGEFVNNVASVGSSASGAAVAPIVVNNYYCDEAVASGVSVRIDDSTVVGYSDDIAGVPMVIVAAGQLPGESNMYPIEVSWADAEYVAGYATGYVSDGTRFPFEKNDSIITVNGYALVDDKQKLNRALEQGKNVSLLNDIVVSGLADNKNAFLMTKPVTIDGGEHKITVSSTTDGRIFTIATPGKVVIKNIDLEIAGISARGINFASGCNNTEVVLDNVDLKVSYYALNIPQGISGTTKLDVKNSHISGYAALNVWSNSEIHFTDSKISSENNYTPQNQGNFSTIVINDAFGQFGNGIAFFTDITFTRTVLNATANNTSTQNVIDYRSNTSGTLKFIDSTINGSGKGHAVLIESEDVLVIVDDVLNISDKSKMEVDIAGRLQIDGLINDNGEGSIIIGEVIGDGYVTGSNATAWASTGAQELVSDSESVTDGTEKVDSNKNTVIITTTSNITTNGLTVNLKDNGNDISVF